MHRYSVNFTWESRTGEHSFAGTEKNFNQPLDYLLQFAEKLPGDHTDNKHFRVVASRSHFNQETEAFVQALIVEGKRYPWSARAAH